MQMISIICSGAYGRRYKSKKYVMEDWNSDKDFICHGLGVEGSYINKSDALKSNLKFVNIIYDNGNKTCVIKLSTLSAEDRD